MAIELATQYLKYVDELFSTESKKSLVTNNDFDWTGAHTVRIYKVGTSAMQDYGRDGPEDGNWSRYGTVLGLDATAALTVKFFMRLTRHYWSTLRVCRILILKWRLLILLEGLTVWGK